MKLNYKRTFFIGLAFLSICSFWQLYDTIIPLILKNTFGFGETVTGVVMAMDNILAIFLLPLFGTLSDKTDTKIGKRTPFILFGTFCAIIFMIFIPIANGNKNLVLFVIALFAVLLSMGFYRSPSVALMPDLTPKPLRSKANAVINLMGAVGGIYTLIMIRGLISKEENPDYMPVFLSVAFIMILSVILLIFTIKEKKLTSKISVEDNDLNISGEVIKDSQVEKDMSPDVRKSLYLILLSIFLWFTAYNAVSTAFSRYAGEVWGLKGGNFANTLLVATGVAIVSYIPIGIISSAIGRKKTILCGITLMTVAYFLGYFFVSYSPGINFVFAITGIGWAAISVNSYPMVVEISRGSDIGKYTGLYYTFSMAAQILTPILSGFFMENISYRILFPYAVVFSVLSFCTMLFVKHGDSRPLKKSNAFEHFDIEE